MRTLREDFFVAEVLRRPLPRPPGDFRYTISQLLTVNGYKSRLDQERSYEELGNVVPAVRIWRAFRCFLTTLTNSNRRLAMNYCGIDLGGESS
ncbi:MAG: hypothetical protein KatS3mg110_2429 [Pirellulaceae bacterium]|nr:MAG: hypothetical protein KatS3mg110_2429 [Pirellulaceae bacterium]